MSCVSENRIEKLRKILKSSDEALLITNEINVGYFSGFHHSEGAMIITQTSTTLLVDFRYIEAAQKFAECNVICFSNGLLKSVTELCKNENINKIYIESSNLTVARYNIYKKHFDEHSIELDISSKLDEAISNIRIIKSDDEFQKILKAQQIAESAYFEVLNYIKPGVSERRIAVELEYLMKQKGAERVSFDLITITGKKTSLPHGVPGEEIICEGDFFTMDFGAVYDGYHSDTTRTVAVKNATDEMKEIYLIVLKAQLAALDVVKSGVKCSDVDITARDIIRQAGYGEYFGHSTGHGVGLEIHEDPVVSYRSDTVLKHGMVITDEPGIYLPDKFGVRIEDMLFVTDDGFKNFVTLSKELIIL
ncbi:MAG: aminopeptidase P family protein [Ruminococcus sp.]|nr:aminopeptidase P family protein [Ruminococcus sp.]